MTLISSLFHSFILLILEYFFTGYIQKNKKYAETLLAEIREAVEKIKVVTTFATVQLVIHYMATKEESRFSLKL